MFDSVLEGEALVRASDADVVATITEAARVEAAASARRLAAIAELVHRGAVGPTDSARWSCDNWDALAAEVACALGVSHGMASSQMYLAVALRNRLPAIAALFADGLISARLAATIVWRTDLIKDPETLRLVDEALASDAERYGPLSANKTAQAIDMIVDWFDPGALRRAHADARTRDVVIDQANDESGTASLWGRLYATDAAVLDRRLLQMAHDVCADDPRTVAQRRADALGALAAGAARLTCSCANADCPARGEAGEPTGVVIHVIAESSAVEDEPAAKPAFISDGGTVPAIQVADLARRGARVRPVRHPGRDAPPDKGYHPSTALEAFVRCRDMTCRFPHCDRPAEFCDVDHTIPYPYGPTHASNLKCVCRKHHLLKTFWTAWKDRQLPDGTVVWTSPRGRTYTTRPGSRLFFPALCAPTGELPTAAAPSSSGAHTVMMPLRRRTRDKDRLARINAERELNAAHVAERNQPPPF
jgi:hypothetical protein